ncbi:MAG TPA: ABC transporter permease [Candidatus Limnocylindrales bacterium]
MAALAAGLRVVEHNALVYRRTWTGSILGTVLSPVLFLAAMGLGLGGYVNRAGDAALGGVDYLAFLGPGLLAAQAMQTAAFETTWPIMGKIVWNKLYEAMLATPLAVPDLLAGELGWLTARLTLVCGVFLAVLAAFGAIRSPLGLLALPVAVLTGLSFGAPIMAFSATQKRDSGFNVIFRFGVTPLFLLGGTFFPIERLPGLVQPLAWLTPLAHGVALCRALTLGRLEPADAVVHLAVLVGFVVAGVALARLAFRRRLVV